MQTIVEDSNDKKLIINLADTPSFIREDKPQHDSNSKSKIQISTKDIHLKISEFNKNEFMSS